MVRGSDPVKARIEVVDVFDRRANLHLRGSNRRRLTLRLDYEGKCEAEVSRELHGFFGVPHPSAKRYPLVGATGLCGLDVDLDESCEWLEFGGKVLGNKPAKMEPKSLVPLGTYTRIYDIPDVSIGAENYEAPAMNLISIDDLDAVENEPDAPDESEMEAALDRIFDAEMTALEDEALND